MAAVAPVLIDRADVHKSCKSLEGIVAALTDYTEAANVLATVQKKLAKALKESASVKGTNNVPASAMMNCAGVFEALAEVDLKFAKVADKETEYVGSELKKWFKKLAKEEKAHDERITMANTRIKQAGQAYEKKARKRDRDAPEEHSRYLAILNSVGPEMSQDKYNHNLAVTQRHTMTLSGCAASISRFAEAEWARACENVRRSAPCIGNVGEWRALCEGGWSGPVPQDIPDLGAENDRGKRNNDTTNKTYDATRTLMPPPPASTNEYPDSPTSLSMTKNLPSVGQSSETNAAPDHPQQLLSRPPSPPSVPKSNPNTLRKKPDSDNSAPALSIVPQQMTSKEMAGSPETSVATHTVTSDPSSTSSGDVRSLLAPVNEQEAPPLPIHEREVSPDTRSVSDTADADRKLALESKRSYSQLAEEALNKRDLFLGDRGQGRSPDPMSERVRDQKVVTSSPISPKIARTTGGAALNRRMSVESTTSNGSLVAVMRDRYDTRPAQPASPPPRDAGRLAQKATGAATRYTAVASPTIPRHELAAERFPTFQDRYPRNLDRDRDRDKDRDRYRSPLDPPASDRDYFAGRDTDRYPAFKPVPSVDRNVFLREDRERHRPRSPDRYFADEMGVRERLRRIDQVAEERALQEREERLREREQELEMERARLASSRDGYASDASGRSARGPHASRRLVESPEPTSAQSLRPPDVPSDHSPNCGCERCSARHYASSTPSLPLPREKLEPPIKLRPEKPKSWIRRLSMPVAAPSKSAGVGIANIALPEEDGRISRRSFEMEREKEIAPRLVGTTRR